MAAKILDSETSNFKSWSLKWKKRLESAAIIAASLLRYSSHPSTKKILELLAQSLRAIDDAVKAESKRLAQKNAELKSGTVAIGGGK
jgi:hypothetical protein